MSSLGRVPSDAGRERARRRRGSNFALVVVCIVVVGLWVGFRVGFVVLYEPTVLRLTPHPFATTAEMALLAGLDDAALLFMAILVLVEGWFWSRGIRPRPVRSLWPRWVCILVLSTSAIVGRATVTPSMMELVLTMEDVLGFRGLSPKWERFRWVLRGQAAVEAAAGVVLIWHYVRVRPLPAGPRRKKARGQAEVGPRGGGRSIEEPPVP